MDSELELTDNPSKGKISRRQLLMRAGAGGLLTAPVVYTLARWLTTPTPLVFRYEYNKPKKLWQLSKSTNNGFVEPPRVNVIFNEYEPLYKQKRLRVAVSFDFQGSEAEAPLRRRVELVAVLLDQNDRPLVSSNQQFLDRRKVAENSLQDAWTASRGGISSRLSTSFNFQPQYSRRLAFIELRFQELDPLKVLPNDPYA